ncbi:MAG: Glu/Leu/Phe/Val dehydrogenase dimerization domain-containing protein [Acidimicrobiales bacterium]
MTKSTPTDRHAFAAIPGVTRRGLSQGLIDDDPEELVVVHDRASGLHAAISIQSTVLGPALGGCRFHAYDSMVDAVEDAVRLGRAMTAKASVAGLDLGGGKAVILGDPALDRTEPMMRAFGRLVEQLDGRYITAEDVGTTTADMDLIRSQTAHVVGCSSAAGGAGDPSAATALGVFAAMGATVGHVLGGRDLVGVRVVVLGVGKVGRPLVELLVGAGARVTIADVDPAAVAAVSARFPVDVVAPAEAHRQTCDVFAPCALGGVLNDSVIAELGCRMAVGSANNQLGEPLDADRLADAGIVYAPDYVVNAGGLIHVSDDLHGFDAARVDARVLAIGPLVRGLLVEADETGITPSAAADRLARRRIERRSAELLSSPAA